MFTLGNSATPNKRAIVIISISRGPVSTRVAATTVGSAAELSETFASYEGISSELFAGSASTSFSGISIVVSGSVEVVGLLTVGVSGVFVVVVVVAGEVAVVVVLDEAALFIFGV